MKDKHERFADNDGGEAADDGEASLTGSVAECYAAPPGRDDPTARLALSEPMTN